MYKGFRTGFWLGFVLLLLLSTSATAATTPVETSVTPALQEPLRSLYLSIALNQGTSSLSDPVPGVTSTSGTRTELMFLGTWDLGRFALEAGGGWLHDSLSGQATPSGFGITNYDLVTDAGVAEISPQVRLVDRFRVGPVAELVMGPDVSFSPGIGSAGKSTLWLAGGQALYEFRLGSNALRAGARYLRSLDLPDHSLQSFQATLQFGLPVL